MSKIIAIGDIHASGFNDDPIVDSLPARLTYIKRTLNYILEYGTKHGIKEYVMLGDLIHDKTIIYNIAQSMMYEFFNDWCDEHFYIISGNHDLSSTGVNQKSAIEVFDSLSNVTCITRRPEVTDIGFFVPYTNTFVEDVKKYGHDNCNIIYAHVGLNEAVLQSGLSKVDKLKINDLKDFKLAILGHYHGPQMIKGTATIAYYAGSIIPRDWNDKNDVKRFLIVDTDTLEVESVDIPDTILGIPMFIELVISPNETDENIKSVLVRADEYRKKGHHVRVINRNKTKIKDQLEDVIVLEQQQVDFTNRGITVDQSKLDQCKKYLEIKEIPEDERDAYIKILQDNKLLEILED